MNRNLSVGFIVKNKNDYLKNTDTLEEWDLKMAVSNEMFDISKLRNALSYVIYDPNQPPHSRETSFKKVNPKHISNFPDEFWENIKTRESTESLYYVM